jgi:hypothetical protein
MGSSKKCSFSINPGKRYFTWKRKGANKSRFDRVYYIPKISERKISEQVAAFLWRGQTGSE